MVGQLLSAFLSLCTAMNEGHGTHWAHSHSPQTHDYSRCLDVNENSRIRALRARKYSSVNIYSFSFGHSACTVINNCREGGSGQEPLGRAREGRKGRTGLMAGAPNYKP